MKPVLTTGEAAKLCGLGVSTIKRWIGRRSLKAYRTPGGDNRIRREDLFDFLRSCGMPLLATDPAQEKTRTILFAALSDDDNRRLTRAVSADLENITIKTVADEFALGAILANTPPDYIVLAKSDAKKLAEQCQHIRALIKPATVRIGVIGGRRNGTTMPQTSDAPEVIAHPRDDTAWATEFIQALIGVTFEVAAATKRVAV